ncbi:RNA polymerase sigma factor [Luteimonas huabeiensis]|uniref:RNA polymerase sigma factor n=1 Tax=Luteimonas huabeiensis TaxID=1244513 RepID=UPI000465C455|nr:sigma-70 family RNA polymerase sigma factor [Luteimonas huabeiensis]
MSGPDAAAVLAEHGAFLRRLASGYERNRSDQEELVQEMAIAVWRSLPKYRGDGSLKGFVAKVAQFAALERLRRRRPAHDDGDALDRLEAPGPGPERQFEAQQRQRRLMAAVSQLPLGQRECVLLALEGFGNGEIAGILGIQANTVDQRLSRARALLRARLETTHA